MGLLPPEPAAPEAEVSALALPEVVAVRAELLYPGQPVLAQLVLPAQPLVLAWLAALAPLQLEAELAVEEVPLLHRSFLSAMVGNLPSTVTPRYSPVPRSVRKAKRRP